MPADRWKTSEFTVRGSGPIGPYWAPIPYSWPYGTRGRTRRRPQKPRRWKVLSSVTGRIDLHLKRALTEKPAHGAAGWFAENLGFFAKQTERYSAKEFLARYAKFLAEIRQRIVLLIEIDYHEVYVWKSTDGQDRLGDALTAAYEYLRTREGASKVLISTLGRADISGRDDLEVTLEAQYNRKHGDGKPGIEIRILGIPSTLVRRPGEVEGEYAARIRGLSDEKGNVRKEKFARRYENTGRIFLRDCARRLSKFFEVAGTTRWLHLEWGKLDTESKRRIKL